VSTTPTIQPPATPTLSVTLDPELIDALALAVARRVSALIPVPVEDGWLDGYAAARYLGIPYSTFKRHTAAGRIVGERDTDGGRFYYQRSYLDGWRRDETA
jgi:hypothetical protein